MGSSVFPAAASGATEIYFPVATSGTYTLVVASGLYKVRTSVASTTITLIDSDGFEFGCTTSGNESYLVVPVDTAQIRVTEAVAVTLSLTSYTLASAPSDLSWSWTGVNSLGQSNGILSFTYPALSTTGQVFWTNATNAAMGSSPATLTPLPAVMAGGITRKILIVAKDANGNFGRGVKLTTDASPTASRAIQFTSSSSWLAPTGVTAVELLVVAGGGSGGYSYHYQGQGGGGGGGGGTRYFAAYSVTPSTNYSVTVGAGGNPSSSGGGNSAFGAISATGGGGGGYSNSSSGQSGGSGGGGGASLSGGSGNTGGYSPVEGYAGGSGDGRGGGGGGATAAGTTPNGGAGYTSSITGTSYVYASGGGGGRSAGNGPGTPGTGGGPGGTMSNNNAAVNYGAGGGGGGTTGSGGFYEAQPGGAGRQGIVIVKYTA